MAARAPPHFLRCWFYLRFGQCDSIKITVGRFSNASFLRGRIMVLVFIPAPTWPWKMAELEKQSGPGSQKIMSVILNGDHTLLTWTPIATNPKELSLIKNSCSLSSDKIDWEGSHTPSMPMDRVEVSDGSPGGLYQDEEKETQRQVQICHLIKRTRLCWAISQKTSCSRPWVEVNSDKSVRSKRLQYDRACWIK